jgi:hypothetical protein
LILSPRLLRIDGDPKSQPRPRRYHPALCIDEETRPVYDKGFTPDMLG